jgi:hypothetical protein
MQGQLARSQGHLEQEVQKPDMSDDQIGIEFRFEFQDALTRKS